MAYESFKELRVWQEAKALAIEIYKITAQGNFSKDYGLKDQLQRAAVSVASNIAEGYERNSDKDFISKHAEDAGRKPGDESVPAEGW
jgi:four helix bundle protein